MRKSRPFYVALSALAATIVSGCGSDTPQMTSEQAMLETGKAVFTTCAGCHGNDAQGRDYMYAPNLTGQSPAYIKRQLMDFRTGKRGKIEDPHGFPMVGRATAIGDEDQVDAVVKYISSLPEKSVAGVEGKTVPVAVEGPIETCATCHGADGRGNPDMQAPALTILGADYIARQLHKFRDGLRGYDEADSQGQLMAANASMIDGDSAIDSIATYYGSSSEKQ